MKAAWMERVAHLHAQDAAYFLVFMLAVVALAVWTEWRRG